jgi:hypothetical protein
MKTAAGGAKQPGAIAGTSVSDNAPPTVLGSTFRVSRLSTTNVTLVHTAAVNKAPAGFFDTLDWITSDMSWDGNNLTINTEGTYLVNVQYNASASNASAGIFQNNAAVRQMGGESTAAISGMTLLYLKAGDVLTPGYYVSANTAANGDNAGLTCYFEVALMNRSLA